MRTYNFLVDGNVISKKLHSQDIINKYLKKEGPKHRTLRHTRCYRPPWREFTINSYPLAAICQETLQQHQDIIVIPRTSSFNNKWGCETESKALDRSKNKELRGSREPVQSRTACSKRDTVERFCRIPNWLSLSRLCLSRALTSCQWTILSITLTTMLIKLIGW